jgi:hypothetical protein
MRKFAGRLLELETNNPGSSQAESAGGFHAVEKIQPHLSHLMGSGGWRSLLSRAFALAGAEVRWLRAVQVRADGTLEGMEELRAQITPEDFLEGEVVVLARLLGLLVAFIGETLTLRLLGEVWPNLSLNDLDAGDGNKK